MSGEKILIVEDSVITSRQIAAALIKMGYIVAAIVDTGADAIKKAYMLKPDLVLSDIILKGKMTGIESAKEIRDNLRIPVVFLTAHSEDDLREKAVTAEPFGYLLKPLDERTLKSTIEMALYNHAIGVKLKESEQKLTGILNHITDGVWSLSWPDMTAQYNSPSVEKLYGRSLQEFIDTPSLWAEVTHPDDRQLYENTLEQLQKAGSADRECRIIRPDGSIVWIHEKSHLIFDEHGTPVRVEGITSDITGRKRAEEALADKALQLERMIDHLTATEQELRASVEELEKGERTLRESEEKFRTLVENANEAIMVVQEGMIRRLNPMSFVISGYAEQELIKKPFIEFIHPDDRAMVLERSIKRIKSEQVPSRYSFRIIHKNQNLIWVEISAVRILWEGRLAILIYLYDITQRKLAEEALADKALQLERMNEQLTATEQELRASIDELEQNERMLKESEEQLALAMEGSGAGLWDWHVQTGKTVFNERWAEIAGYTLAELSPVSIDTWINLCHTDDLQQSDERLKKHFKKESPSYECEVRIRHKDGHWVRVLDRGKVVTWDSEGLPIRMTGTHVDITDITGIAIRKTSEPGKGAQFGMTVSQGELPVSEREGGV